MKADTMLFFPLKGVRPVEIWQACIPLGLTQCVSRCFSCRENFVVGLA